MPELPEVEYARRQLERILVGQTVHSAWCADDAIVFEGVTGRAFEKAVVGAGVIAAHRHGKQLWLELDRRPWPLLHFGMTGRIEVRGEVPIDLESVAGATPAWPPRFCKLRLSTSNGNELAMTDPRRFGRLRLRRDPRAEPPLAGLGFDALLERPPAAELRDRLARRRGPIKAVLLQQRFVAGLGNWLVDDILYQARIDPRRVASALSDEAVVRLLGGMAHVVDTAVSVDADAKRFPRAWLFHLRWGRERPTTTVDGERLVFETIAGRTTAWVPSVQT